MKERAKEELKDIGAEVGKMVGKALLERLREWWRYDRPRAKHKRPKECK